MISSRRIKKTLHAVVCLLVLSFGSYARAEGGCPPGQYPQQGQGWQTCVPIPGATTNQEPSPPSQKWYPRAGAIAADGKMGILGTADNERSRSTAENLAMADCKRKGGLACVAQTSYVNGCGAMTVGATGFGTATGRTQDEAIANSLKQCQSTGDTCHEFYSACSLPSAEP